ncbi:hypothetical protein BJX63DRAFT_361536 [Aspergillus granulosus]|uniref:Uncharacterized protein n=1 Tax=Aspergillus granulosus TaxID=176169 RepID=A0ABR4HWM3_9EURO
MLQGKKMKQKTGIKQRPSRYRNTRLNPWLNIMARLLLGCRRQGPRPKRRLPLTNAVVIKRLHALIISLVIVAAVAWQVVLIFHHLVQISRFMHAVFGELVYGPASDSNGQDTWKVMRAVVCTLVSYYVRLFFVWNLTCVSTDGQTGRLSGFL